MFHGMIVDGSVGAGTARAMARRVEGIGKLPRVKTEAPADGSPQGNH
jgi:hypothetical protein